MGYINRAAGIPNFSKAVISIWFYVPTSTIVTKGEEALEWADGDGVDGDLIGVVPFVTFGPNSETAFFEGLPDTGPLSPCVVGVHCWDGEAFMYFRAQYDSGSQGYFIDYNDFFQVGGRVGTGVISGAGTPALIEVTGDAWHHILLSFDFTDGCSTHWDAVLDAIFDSVCPFYWAFDGVNKDGNHLWPYTPSMFGHAAVQGIVSDLCVNLAPDEPPTEAPSSHAFGAGDITTSGNAMGFPSAADRAAKRSADGQRLAEVQIYTGVTLDTSVGSNVLAFRKADGTPEAKSFAAALLGKEPEVYFRTHTDWINGINQGTAGNFSATGTISQVEAPG